jgi:hypothetical protein
MKLSLRVSVLWLRVLSCGSAFVPLTVLLQLRFAYCLNARHTARRASWYCPVIPIALNA